MDILASLGLTAYALRPAMGLPYGTLKRIELARAMAARPELLLLDEPASGLTHAEVDELAKTIQLLRDEHELTILLVEHHMQLVMGISGRRCGSASTRGRSRSFRSRSSSRRSPTR